MIYLEPSRLLTILHLPFHTNPERLFSVVHHVAVIRENHSFDKLVKHQAHKFVLSLTPEKIEAIAALTYIEMLECGFSSVGEFHYVHNQIDGSNYSDIAETSYSIIRAAIETGIGLTILPVFYVGDILNDGKPSKGQIRFFNNEEQYLKIIYKTEKALIKAPCDYSIGIAPHSLRAIPIELLKEIVNIRFNGPIHIHVAEQNKEVELIKSNFGARPVEWLLNNFNINSRWCLIHATHMNQKETKNHIT